MCPFRPHPTTSKSDANMLPVTLSIWYLKQSFSLSFCLFKTHVSAEIVYLSELHQTLPADDHFIVVSLEITFFSLLPHHLCSNSTFQTDYSSINVSVCEPPHLINITVDTIAADNICHVIWATIWVAVHVKQVSMVMFGGHASVVTVSHDSYSRPSQHQQDVWQTLQQQNYHSLWANTFWETLQSSQLHQTFEQLYE